MQQGTYRISSFQNRELASCGQFWWQQWIDATSLLEQIQGPMVATLYPPVLGTLSFSFYQVSLCDDINAFKMLRIWSSFLKFKKRYHHRCKCLHRLSPSTFSFTSDASHANGLLYRPGKMHVVLVQRFQRMGSTQFFGLLAFSWKRQVTALHVPYNTRAIVSTQ